MSLAVKAGIVMVLLFSCVQVILIPRAIQMHAELEDWKEQALRPPPACPDTSPLETKLERALAHAAAKETKLNAVKAALATSAGYRPVDRARMFRSQAVQLVADLSGGGGGPRKGVNLGTKKGVNLEAGGGKRCSLEGMEPVLGLPWMAEEKIRVMVFMNGYGKAVGKAGKGGPMGELVLYHSILAALESLDELVGAGNVVLATSKNEVVEALKELPWEAYDVVFTDQYSFSVLEDLGLFNLEADKCKYRFVDFWGTPPNQNSVCFHLHQYLTPYQNEWNQRIGYDATASGSTPKIVNDILGLPPQPDSENIKDVMTLSELYAAIPVLEPRIKAANATKFAIVWGKETKYFAPYKTMLERAAATEGLALVATVEERSLRGRVPSSVIPLGLLGKREWRSLLAHAQFVLGLSHPVLGPTVFDAVSVGTPFLNPTFRSPFQLPDNTKWALKSQHPVAADLAPEHVHTFDPRDPVSLNAAINSAIHSKAKRLKPFVPKPYTPDAVKAAVRKSLETDFCAAFWPKD